MGFGVVPSTSHLYVHLISSLAPVPGPPSYRPCLSTPKICASSALPATVNWTFPFFRHDLRRIIFSASPAATIWNRRGPTGQPELLQGTVEPGTKNEVMLDTSERCHIGGGDDNGKNTPRVSDVIGTNGEPGDEYGQDPHRHDPDNHHQGPMNSSDTFGDTGLNDLAKIMRAARAAKTLRVRPGSEALLGLTRAQLKTRPGVRERVRCLRRRLPRLQPRILPENLLPELHRGRLCSHYSSW